MGNNPSISSEIPEVRRLEKAIIVIQTGIRSWRARKNYKNDRKKILLNYKL